MKQFLRTLALALCLGAGANAWGHLYTINGNVNGKAHTVSGRKLNSFGLKVDGGAAQTFGLTTAQKNKTVNDFTSTAIFTVPTGVEITPQIQFTGWAMHTYWYMDLDNDGEFDVNVGTSASPNGPSDGNECVSWSCYNNYNSKGTYYASMGDAFHNGDQPSFTLPATLAPGTYHARLKIDWNDIDPATSRAENGSNYIVTNGGYIIEFVIHVAADGEALEPGQQPNANESDYYPVYSGGLTATVNRSNNDRFLNSFTLTGQGANDPASHTFAVNASTSNNKVYHNLTGSGTLHVTPGERIHTNVDYTGGWMHTYLYIDYNNDHIFTNVLGTNNAVQAGSELVSFSQLGDYDSNGTQIPSDNDNRGSRVNKLPDFNIKADLAPGTYRARLKIDWDNADAKGQTSIAANGGYIVDFLITYETDELSLVHEVEAQTTSPLYGTYCNPKAYTMPTGLTGYAVSGVQDGEVQLAEAYSAGTVVPTGTPLLLAGTQDHFEVYFTSAAGTAYTGTNWLHGDSEVDANGLMQVTGDTGTEKQYTYYTLNYEAGGTREHLGFYYAAAGGAPAAQHAHKAYLAVPRQQANGIKGFRMPGHEGTTGISAIPSDDTVIPAAQRGVWTLSGVRVSTDKAKLAPGIYIMDGKKIIVK